MDIKKYIINSKKICVRFNLDLYNDETELLDEVGLLLTSNVNMIQILFDKKSDTDVIKWGLKLRDLTSNYSSLLIVQKRADISKIIKADGIFLETFDMTIKNAIDILGHDSLIGLGYYDSEADYLILTSYKDNASNIPVFYPYSKKNQNGRVFFDKKPKENILSLINSI